MNIKRYTEYDREEWSKNNKKIHIYRQRTFYLSKDEARKAKENKEQLNATR